jgi:hypothetical protein
LQIDNKGNLIKSELITPSLPHKNNVTASSQMPTPSSKVDIPSSFIKEPKSSSLEPFDQTLAIDTLQQENVQLLQQLEEKKTMDRHLQNIVKGPRKNPQDKRRSF